VICSMPSSEPVVWMVMRDKLGSSVGATVRDSMLEPRAEKKSDHARQRAGFVFKQQGNDVFHGERFLFSQPSPVGGNRQAWLTIDSSENTARKRAAASQDQRSSLPRSISVMPLPAWTIGNTFSVGSVRMSRNTVRSFRRWASRNAGSTSSGRSISMPTWP